MLKKRGQMWDTLIPWLIALGVLVLILILYGVLTGKGGAAIDYFRTILRFGR
jgi:hypothetical protein